MPLFTYRSPQRRWGLIFTGAGAFFLIAALFLFIRGFIAAATNPGGGVLAILDSVWGPLLLGVLGVFLVVGGGAALFTSWFGPTSLDDDERISERVIWGRCTRCGRKNGPFARTCAECGRAL